MALVDHYELIMKIIANVESARWKDEPMNDLAHIWLDGHETAMNSALSEIRKEL